MSGRKVGDVQFAWDANSEGDLASYKLYIGRETGIYTSTDSPINVGNVTTYTYNVPTGGEWYFALTAVNTSTQESDFSAEVNEFFSVPLLLRMTR